VTIEGSALNYNEIVHAIEKTGAVVHGLDQIIVGSGSGLSRQRQGVGAYDLLLYWREAVQMPGIAAQMRADFDHILVDDPGRVSPA